MASQDPKSHCASQFDCFDLRNEILPLMMPSTSDDADTGANGVT